MKGEGCEKARHIVKVLVLYCKLFTSFLLKGKQMNKKLWCFILLATVLLSVPAYAVNTISMNFAENTNQVFSGGELIGPLKTNSSHWNNTGANIPTGTMDDLIDGTGAATTADASWASNNTWYNGDGTATDEAKLAVGYLDDGGDGASFSVTSIPFTTYDVYVLFTSDNNGDYTHGVITINGTAVLGGGEFPAHGRVTDGTGWVESNGIIHGNYVRVNNLSGDLTVSSVRTPASRAPLTAFIIAEVSDVVHVLDQSPVDGATRVGQDVQLDWDVRSATGTPSFDVYLSSDPNDVDPNAVATATTTDTFYTPATPLDPATLYYWRIDVSDDVNTVPIMGDVFTFTTGGDVVGLYPADGATGVETDVTISWTGDAPGSTYIDEYAIYFGETLPGTPSATATEPNLFWQTPELTDNTTYQCKVVSMHMGTPVAEATVSFTTGSLVGYWPFDDNLTDMVGSNDATRANPHFGTGVIGTGSAAEFSESYGDERIVIAIPDVATGGSWTISLWDFSDAEIGGGWESILGNGADADGWGTFEFGRYNFNRYIFGLTGTYRATPNDSSYLRGGWQCHTISYDSVARAATWYINGESVSVYSGKTFTLDGELSVGNVKGLSQPFNGKVDDLKLYSRPLTGAQVLQSFIDDLAGKPYNPSPAVGTGDMPWDATLEWRFAETPDSAVIEIGMEADLSDATTVALTGDMTSFDTFAGLGIHLTPSTGYYWRVIPTYDGTPVTGPTWYFVVRDLLGDLSGNLMVNMEDFGALSAQWNVDTFEIVPSGAQHPFVDQEAWSSTGGDPNLAEFDAYVAPGGAWGTSELTVKTDPTTSTDPNFPTPTQTLLWTATGDAGQQQLAGLVFPDGPIDFSQFDRFGFWTYQTNCDGNFQFRPITTNAAQPITKTVWGMNANNDKWHNYEWEVGGSGTLDIYKVDIWVGDNEFTIEYSDFYLVKDGVEVPLCFEENWFAEDLNNDCIVDILDVEVLAGDWLLDASN